MFVMRLDIRVKVGTLRTTAWLVLSVVLKDKGAVVCLGILDPYYKYIEQTIQSLNYCFYSFRLKESKGNCINILILFVNKAVMSCSTVNTHNILV